MNSTRVRFAPSPTGALHIGGVRTALYNYLFARNTGGTFILRVEDTDRTRYTEGAEGYIFEVLEWLGIEPDESPNHGGKKGPYRQSDRKEIYAQYAHQLIENGSAYYAFDSPEELEAMRERKTAEGVHSPKYDHTVRHEMRNSLSLPAEEVQSLLDQNVPYVIRLKVPEDETISFEDEIRSHVHFEGKELDDKVLVKADGMPTYHMANVIDDYLMEITHVIRGEEWLSSTAHHVLLYRAFGWEEQMPAFAHLPLILKPSGKGKLSKRDGQKLGIPVFPINWGEGEEQLQGFREMGFHPAAVLNFLAFLGWNPGTEQEFFSLDELIKAFTLQQIGKSGARFDYDKALWFNQQYILQEEDSSLQAKVRALLEQHGLAITDQELEQFTELYRPRVQTYPDFWEQGHYVFTDIQSYDVKMIRKKWKGKGRELFAEMIESVEKTTDFQKVDEVIKSFMETHELGFGQVLPLLRLSCCGTMKGPDLFSTMKLIGQTACVQRMQFALEQFDSMTE